MYCPEKSVAWNVHLKWPFQITYCWLLTLLHYHSVALYDNKCKNHNNNNYSAFSMGVFRLYSVIGLLCCFFVSLFCLCNKPNLAFWPHPHMDFCWLWHIPSAILIPNMVQCTFLQKQFVQRPPENPLHHWFVYNWPIMNPSIFYKYIFGKWFNLHSVSANECWTILTMPHHSQYICVFSDQWHNETHSVCACEHWTLC